MKIWLKRFSVVVVLIITLFIVIGIGASGRKKEQEITPYEMLEQVENALGDEFKKHSVTEIAATLTYGNKNEKGKTIYYHIVKTTYYEGNPSAVNGLNVDALRVLFDPDCAESSEEMLIQDWNACLYNLGEKSYLCWTDTPEVSYILEYDPDVVSDADIIKMAESCAPIQ